jgi:hypothetical protein
MHRQQDGKRQLTCSAAFQAVGLICLRIMPALLPAGRVKAMGQGVHESLNAQGGSLQGNAVATRTPPPHQLHCSAAAILPASGPCITPPS